MKMVDFVVVRVKKRNCGFYIVTHCNFITYVNYLYAKYDPWTLVRLKDYAALIIKTLKFVL